MNDTKKNGYLVTGGMGIVPVEIITMAEDGGCIFRRSDKTETLDNADYKGRVFPTWKEARQYAIEKTREKYDQGMSMVDTARKILDTLIVLEEPKDTSL